jgi:hypothetical protein
VTHLKIILDGEGAWPDLKGRIVHHATTFEVAALASGMTSGSPSVGIRIDLPDGSAVMAETSLKLFLTAADALRGAHGDPR